VLKKKIAGNYINLKKLGREDTKRNRGRRQKTAENNQIKTNI
jgi:hypothetical protein